MRFCRTDDSGLAVKNGRILFAKKIGVVFAVLNVMHVNDSAGMDVLCQEDRELGKPFRNIAEMCRSGL